MPRKPPLPRAAEPDGPDKPLPVPKRLEPQAPPADRRQAVQGEAPASPHIEGEDRLEDEGLWRQLLSLRSMTSFMVSCGFHVVLIVVLSLIVTMIPAREPHTLVVSTDPGDSVSPRDLDDARVIVSDSATPESSSTMVAIGHSFRPATVP